MNFRSVMLQKDKIIIIKVCSIQKPYIFFPTKNLVNHWKYSTFVWALKSFSYPRTINWSGRNIGLSWNECDLKIWGNAVWFSDFCILMLDAQKMFIHWGRILISKLLEKRGLIKPVSYVPVGLKSSQVIGLQNSDYVKDSWTVLLKSSSDAARHSVSIRSAACGRIFMTCW